jgi:hypothetical protein
MIAIPNGSTIAIAASYGTVKMMSAVSNANPASATLETGHAVAAGDYLEVTSGWEHLNDKVVRAGTVSSSEVGLLGIDTTLPGAYPAGMGGGSVREILTWAALTQVLTSAASGSEQQYKEFQFLESDHQKRVPTVKTALTLTFTVADDITLPGYLAACAANDEKTARAIKVTYPNGSMIVYNAFVSVNKTPSMSINDVMACTITLAVVAEPVRY